MKGDEYNVSYKGEFMATLTEDELIKQFRLDDEHLESIMTDHKGKIDGDYSIRRIYNRENEIIRTKRAHFGEENLRQWDMFTEPIRVYIRGRKKRAAQANRMQII